MSRHLLNRIDTLEMHFDSEFVHYADLSVWWLGVLQALWDSANEHCPKEHVRAMLDTFQGKVKALELPAPSTRVHA